MKRYKILICLLALFWATAVFSPRGRAESAGEVDVPIIMYHMISQNSAHHGKFTISPEEFESDLRYLKEHGYQTVTMAELAAYVHEGAELPEKPVVLTFDDGASGDYRYAFPLLQKYEMKAVSSVIGKVVDEYTAEAREGASYPHLTWPQVQEMAQSGCVEIQNHSYALHSGCGADKKCGETEECYSLRLSSDLMQAQERIYEMTGRYPNTFTYPFGAYCGLSEEVLRQLGFSASLVCEAKVNRIQQGNGDSLFRLGRILRPHGVGSGDVFSRFGIV